MKDRYTFIALFTFEDDGISIEFPDLPGCLSCADTQEEALYNAQEVLGLYLVGMEDDGEEILSPTPLNKISLEKNQIPTLVQVYMPLARQQAKPVSVKKTLTIPSWLNVLAEENHINFSQLLQKALKEQLNINA